MKLPNGLVALALLSLLVGGWGLAHAFGQQVVPYLHGHVAFVEDTHADLVAAADGAPSDAVARAADLVAEKRWTRRGIDVPLGLVNLVLSAMLFLGALRALAGSAWGWGAFQFAAKLSIPYTLLAAVVGWIEAADMQPFYLVLNAATPAPFRLPLQDSAHLMEVVSRIGSVGVAAVLVALYATTVIYLGRPKVKALFREDAA